MTLRYPTLFYLCGSAYYGGNPEILRDDGMIHTSRQMKEHARKIAIVREQMKKTQNKEPTLQELAEKTGIAIEDLVVAMEAGREVDSFSRPVTENDGKVLTLEEKLEDNHRFETPLLNHIALKQAIDQLPEEEAQLIKFRYMDNLSQAETAKRMGKIRYPYRAVSGRYWKNFAEKCCSYHLQVQGKSGIICT